MRKLAALVIALCMMGACCALAEENFFPAMDFAGKPIEARLTVDVSEQMPFDEVRVGWLNDLLKHTALVLRASEADGAKMSQMSLQIDGSQAVGVTCREEADGRNWARFNVLPGVTYQGGAEVSALSVLPGFETPDTDLYGLDGTESDWLKDGEALMYAMLEHFQDSVTNKASRTTISGFTTAERRKTLSVAKADAEAFREELIAVCPEGKLRELLSGLVFGGKLSFVFNTLNDGTIIRMNLTGRIGADAEHLHEVNLTVRMLRRDDLVKSAIELKSPAVSGHGTDYHTISYTGKLTRKNGVQELKAEFTYKRRIDKKITTTTGEVELTRKDAKSGVTVTGSIALENDPPLDNNAEAVKANVNLTFQDDVSVEGSVGVERTYNKKVQQAAVVTVSVREGFDIPWKADAETVDVESLSDEERAVAGETIMRKANAAIVRPLVLLPREETYYLSYGLPDELWQQIVDAARKSAE